jgi:acyl-CoA synthetase (AMP-forming)/AMP-acid ligase II
LDAVDRTGADISTLRECSLGAAPVSPLLVSRCERAGMRVFRRYGATEHPSITAGDPGDALDKRLSTEGRCMPGNRIRLVDDFGRDVKAGDEGEIASRGPERFLGYLDPSLDADAFLPGGWYRTGDLGRIDDDGYLVLTDRKKDVIIRGGENISSREVEDILTAHPDIAEAAAVARPDHRMGERVCAFVVPRESRTVTLDSIREHFASRGVARQKTPEYLRLVDALPRNATGKVLKHVLRDGLAAETPAEQQTA